MPVLYYQQPTQDQIDYITQWEKQGWKLCEGPFRALGPEFQDIDGVVCTFSFQFSDSWELSVEYTTVLIESDGCHVHNLGGYPLSEMKGNILP